LFKLLGTNNDIDMCANVRRFLLAALSAEAVATLGLSVSPSADANDETPSKQRNARRSFSFSNFHDLPWSAGDNVGASGSRSVAGGGEHTLQSKSLPAVTTPSPSGSPRKDVLSGSTRKQREEEETRAPTEEQVLEQAKH